jgi:glycoside/pentoside/hexuronide:cation symporter, GPH family
MAATPLTPPPLARPAQPASAASAAAAGSGGLGASRGLAYGALGLPLSFVALPLYVVLPDHHARELGLPLASLGLMLLAVRALDALADPWLGVWADHGLAGPPRRLAGVMAAAALVLALAFVGAFFPPVQGTGALLAWTAVMLMLCYLAYSGLSVLHQAWGARLGGDAAGRAGVVAWREGLALAGVIAASILPSALGLGVTSAVLALTLAIGLAALWGAAPRPVAGPAGGPGAAGLGGAAAGSPWAPLRQPGFRRLLLVYLINGVASAIPATLLLFFVRDRLQAAGQEPLFLGLYFVAAALSLPLWVRAVARWGLSRCWLAGMGLAIVAFVGATALGPGDGWAFALICAASGLALGADLCAPPALLAGLLRRQGVAEAQAGASFGWWTFTTKLNLALAAGLALPLLQWLGYQPGQASPAGLQALSWLYGGLPCLLKALAALALWTLWMRTEHDA